MEMENQTMKAVVYTRTGDPGVLELVERDMPGVPSGHVRVRIVVSGVNPTDWRSRSGWYSDMEYAEQVPNQDGAGIVDAVADDVADLSIGQRVWLWDAAFGRSTGTAQQYAVVPARHVVLLPDTASFDVGASLGIPALTAYRTLTTSDLGPRRLSPGALAGSTVLVQGGAGAVGHAAIQLARWAGATVVTTVSTPEKAQLSRRAGAHHVINYRTEDVAARLRTLVPGGVHRIVEVDLAANLDTDLAAIAPGGNIAVYTSDMDQKLTIPTFGILVKNIQLNFVFTYTTTVQQKDGAVQAVASAVADGAMEVGEEHGLPLHRYPLEQTAAAHAAVESGVVGKVVIDVAAHS
jgi:NADPH:quinone reductase